MAYQDYSTAQPQVMPRQGGVFGGLQNRVAAQAGAAGMGGGGRLNGIIGPGGIAAPSQAASAAAPELPTNTRQQNLASVQDAFAARAPGDMGQLNSLISQSAAPVSPTDPSIAPAFAAGRVSDQRNIDRQRAALAEQLGGVGLGDSGAMQTKTGGIQQRVGEQAAMRESGMLYDEGNARRNALLQALGMDQSRYQGDNDMGYRLAALEAQLNQNAMTGLQGYL